MKRNRRQFKDDLEEADIEESHTVRIQALLPLLVNVRGIQMKANLSSDFLAKNRVADYS